MPEGSARPLVLGLSSKTYLGYRESIAWMTAIARLSAARPAVASGAIRVFVAPSFPLLESAVKIFAGTGVEVAAQNASEFDAGAHTGEVSPRLLAELGVSIVELGHAERRAAHGETDAIVTAKVTAAIRNGLTPLLCIGETERMMPPQAITACLEQTHSALAGATPERLILAYEPVWAIGAERPAEADYVREVTEGIRAGLPAELAAAGIIYGGSAGPGLLGSVWPSVDGLFLGRFAHEPAGFASVLAEAEALLG